MVNATQSIKGSLSSTPLGCYDDALLNNYLNCVGGTSYNAGPPLDSYEVKSALSSGILEI